FGCSHSLPLEGLIAPGDSGGGLFITTSTGTYLAGVNSFVGSDSNLPNSMYGNFSGHTRVSAYSDWIEANPWRRSCPVRRVARRQHDPATIDSLSGPRTRIIRFACRCRRAAGNLALPASLRAAIVVLWNLRFSRLEWL